MGAFVLKAAGDDNIIPGSVFANRGKVEKLQPPPPAGKILKCLNIYLNFVLLKG